jgi:hypothetical protein
MLARSVLNLVLEDEALTRHLGDAEARALIEWLVDEAEHLGEVLADRPLEEAVMRLCRRGRTMARFVRLWCHEDTPGAAAQLAASERLDWPLPDGPVDPWWLMHELVRWETRQRNFP